MFAPARSRRADHRHIRRAGKNLSLLACSCIVVSLVVTPITLGCDMDKGRTSAVDDTGMGDEISAAVSEAIDICVSEVEEKTGGHVTRQVRTHIVPKKISISVALFWVDVKKLPLETKRIARATVKRDYQDGKWEHAYIAEIDGDDGKMLEVEIRAALAKREVPVK
jgi:hypothetical protein